MPNDNRHQNTQMRVIQNPDHYKQSGRNLLNCLKLTCRKSEEASFVNPNFLQDDCAKTSTYANRWSLDDSCAGACCMSTAGQQVIFSVYIYFGQSNQMMIHQNLEMFSLFLAISIDRVIAMTVRGQHQCQNICIFFETGPGMLSPTWIGIQAPTLWVHANIIALLLIAAKQISTGLGSVLQQSRVRFENLNIPLSPGIPNVAYAGIVVTICLQNSQLSSLKLIFFLLLLHPLQLMIIHLNSLSLRPTTHCLQLDMICKFTISFFQWSHYLNMGSGHESKRWCAYILLILANTCLETNHHGEVASWTGDRDIRQKQADSDSQILRQEHAGLAVMKTGSDNCRHRQERHCKKKLAQLPEVDMQKVSESFCCYSNHSPKLIKPSFDLKSLCQNIYICKHAIEKVFFCSGGRKEIEIRKSRIRSHQNRQETKTRTGRIGNTLWDTARSHQGLESPLEDATPSNIASQRYLKDSTSPI
ncbi:hypothetical protein VP01_4437g1 [Puccinia sorghi]|uniref:Uncharacterized protein n=1 Tax=Puccinia sorghi TaxID=27349 RepID=A0A0L6URG8_9BASI|nr:hypothetical protein VP01_4437g1 [Puccinia sorghi]